MADSHRDVVHPFVFGYTTNVGFGSISDVSREFQFSNGVKAFVSCRGTILFDFHECPTSPIVVTRESVWNDLDRTDKKAVDKAVRIIRGSANQEKSNIEYANKIITTHKLCLVSSIRNILGISSEVEAKINYHEMIKGYDFQEHTKIEPRFFRDWTALENSMNFIDLIISHSFVDLLQLMYLFRISSDRLVNWHFSESLILSWTICERIINKIWEDMITDLGLNGESPKDIKERYGKLTKSKEYTSSVKLDILEISRRIDFDVYTQLTAVRAVRNKWLHYMEPVGEEQSVKALGAAAAALNIFSPEKIAPSFSGVGGYGGGFAKDYFEKMFPNIKLPS